MKLKKILTLALVLGISFSGTSFAFAEEEAVVIPTCPETGCVEETTPIVTTSPTIPNYDIFINSISGDVGVYSSSTHYTNDVNPIILGSSNYPLESIGFQYYPIICETPPEGTSCTSSIINAPTDENGNWQVDLSAVSLSVGSYYAIATGGAMTGSGKFYFTIVPQIKILEIYSSVEDVFVYTNNDGIPVINKNRIIFHGTYDGLPGSVQIVLDGVPIVSTLQSIYSAGWVMSYEDVEIPDGQHNATVWGIDSEGNRRTEHVLSSFPFIVDTTTPDAPVIVSPVSGTHNSSKPIIITGTCTPGMTVWFEPRENMAYDSVTDCLDDGTFSYTYNLNVIYQEFSGVKLPVTLSARQKDSVLNISDSSNEVTLTEEVVSSGGGGGSVISEKFLKNDLPVKKTEAQDSATTTVTTEKVFGASRTCPVFTKFIEYGLENNDVNEVKMWQEFLNKQENAGLNVTGFYDFPTYNAVKRFQEKYSEEVLTPWGAKSGTGYVYKTTTKKANQLLGC